MIKSYVLILKNGSLIDPIEFKKVAVFNDITPFLMGIVSIGCFSVIMLSEVLRIICVFSVDFIASSIFFLSFSSSLETFSGFIVGSISLPIFGNTNIDFSCSIILFSTFSI